MPQSLVKILVHVVFSTKNRADLIHPEIEAELYAYIHGIVKNNGSKLIIANGATNHSHFLISMGKTLDISRLVGDIKRASSLWMKQHDRAFYWQEGYGAFSIGESQVTHVVRYIEGQKQHHEKQDFKDEFRGLLDRYKVEHDERYVWD
ncbi:MAG: IS200/IS605 family transposase [Acidobacteria bacterium]|nr:IS200/IS605 family transposase [Acidobacteriota bacterium]